eukprot:TRINITY_DN855_c0_g2_i1.p1 TRINITY_DN855_c0_g2~~TRINITY_DN855_c0_g2_i1.p1  ORF type:complete len:626 (+),score=163.97 TRINITY_DN855_c0_g2_i1:51-1928(+)
MALRGRVSGRVLLMACAMMFTVGTLLRGITSVAPGIVSAPMVPMARRLSILPEQEWNDERDVVMGLARFDAVHTAQPPWDVGLKAFVGTLRLSGYKGRIVLFVHPKLIEATTGAMGALRTYLESRQVELTVGSDVVPCRFPAGFEVPKDIQKGESGKADGGALRMKCTERYPTLPLEWSRFALARDWLRDNPETTWGLVTDVRDTFFQRPPFAYMGPPAGAQSFVYEEYYGDRSKTHAQGKQVGIDTTHWFSRLAEKCYGAEAASYLGKPMLCSGQFVGTRDGLVASMTAYVDEMLANVEKGAQCVTPVVPDQPLLNYLVYRNGLPQTLAPVPFGEGAVMTVGGACTTRSGRGGLRDRLSFDAENYVLDAYGRRAPVIHQWDRCSPWLEAWLRKWLAKRDELPAGNFAHVDETKGESPTDPPRQPRTHKRRPHPTDPAWEWCSPQYDLCECATEIRYGHDDVADRFEYHTPEGGATTCDVRREHPTEQGDRGGPFMTDPAPGKFKECQCRVGDARSGSTAARTGGNAAQRRPKLHAHRRRPEDPEWEWCSPQYDLCECAGEVRFGHDSFPDTFLFYTPEAYIGPITCDSQRSSITEDGDRGGPFESDPAPGQVKECHCRVSGAQA